MISNWVKRIYKGLNYIASYLGPKAHLQFRYFCAFRKKIDWKSPKDLNQLVCWNMVYGNRSDWTILADKYAVRDYISKIGLSHILVPLYHVYNDPGELNMAELPEKCIIKANNGSGDVVIVEDKEKVNINNLRNHFYDIQAKPYGKLTAEAHYLKMPFKIVVEKLLDIKKQDIVSQSLVDYKLWFVNGKFRGVWVVKDRVNGRIKHQWRDENWMLLPDYTRSNNHYESSDFEIPCPVKYNEMIEYGTRMAKGHKVVRVDFYVVDNEIYFGELTFTSAGGMMNFYTSKALKEIIREK